MKKIQMGLAAIAIWGTLTVYAIQDKLTPKSIDEQRYSVIRAMNHVLGERNITLPSKSECLITIFGKAKNKLNAVLSCEGEKVLTHHSDLTNPTDIDYVTQVFNVRTLPSGKLDTQGGCFSFEAQWKQIIGWPDCEWLIDEEIEKPAPKILT